MQRKEYHAKRYMAMSAEDALTKRSKSRKGNLRHMFLQHFQGLRPNPPTYNVVAPKSGKDPKTDLQLSISLAHFDAIRANAIEESIG
jgi:hypothetical protein